MRKFVRADGEFWAKVTVTGLLVNMPLAFAVVVGAMHVGVALTVSMVTGSVLTAIWDRGVKRAPADRPPTR